MINTTLMLLLALNQTSTPAISLECLAYALQAMTGKLPLEEVRDYVVYSGHGFNQIGEYYSCLEAANTSYFMSSLAIDQQTLPFFVGLCFTNKCSSSDLMQLSKLAAQTLHFPIGFSRVVEPITVQYNLDGAGYATIIILALLVTMSIAASAIVYQARKAKSQSRVSKYIQFFSIQKGYSALQTKPTQLKYLNGLKCLSFLAVIFGHQLFVRYNFSRNLLDLPNQLQKIDFVILISYLFAVDVFYLLGGFLTGLLFLKAYFKSPKLWLFPLAVIQRAIRFWPMYIFAILLYWKVGFVSISGPLAFTYPENVSLCQSSYYWDLSLFGNFKQVFCLAWTWYLHVDMQLFILSLIILLIYVQSSRWAKPSAYFLGIGTIIGTIIYIFVQSQINGYKIMADLNQPQETIFNYQLKIYIKPWSRAAPYLLGLFTGIFLYNLQTNQTDGGIIKKLFSHRLIRILSTVIGLFWIIFLTFLPYGILHHTAEWTQPQHSLFLSAGHFMYTLGIVLIILPYFFGYSNPIRTFLENEAFQFVSKISFSGYMIHFIIILRRASQIDTTQYLEPWLIFNYSCQDTVMILVAAFIMCLVVQYPFAFLFDSLLGNKSRGRGKEVTN